MSTMEPFTLAAITSAVTTLATEAAKAGASEAGKSAWAEVKKLLGWSSADKGEDVKHRVEKKLAEEPELARQIVLMLQRAPVDVGAPKALVGKIDAEKVVVANVLNVSGDFKL